MLALLLLAALPSPSPSSVRAEPVEALLSTFPVAREQNGPSTGSGRTEVGNQTALDAERAFAADAQTLGQWTAFRKWAAPEATMFVPQPVNAQNWLKDRKDPAKAIEWWPTTSYASCDGSLAVNTGGWKRPDGAVGYFSTVWQRQPGGGWKWIVDGGDNVSKARPHGRPVIRRASCDRVQAFVESHRHVPPDGFVLPPLGHGYSADSSIVWDWEVGAGGERRFTVGMAGAASPVIDDTIAAPR